MTDEEHGAAVLAAVQQLNAAIAEAWQAGLRIDVETHDVGQMGRRDMRPIVNADVYRHIRAKYNAAPGAAP